jgi:hypothetical protein
MLEYAALTSADPSDLARQMTERSAQGWEILQVVSTGATVTAFVRRAAIAGATTSTTTTTPTASPTPVSPNPTPTPVSQPAATTGISAASTTASTTSSVGDATAPAAWYPDPSGRFELRYWNGSAWTEHVSRNGQQFTDPPVA